MKALLINGSPQEKGCTFAALSKVAEGLGQFEVESEIVWLGTEPVQPCTVCLSCRKTQRCALGSEDGVNELIEKIIAADALVVGSPVHCGGITGQLKIVLDRVFFAADKLFAHKPAAGVVSARRAGTTAALEQLNKFFLICQMPLVASFYWPMVHGTTPEEVMQDKEGCQVAQQLGANMGWLLSCIEAGNNVGVTPFVPQERFHTNFIH